MNFAIYQRPILTPQLRFGENDNDRAIEGVTNVYKRIIGDGTKSEIEKKAAKDVIDWIEYKGKGSAGTFYKRVGTREQKRYFNVTGMLNGKERMLPVYAINADAKLIYKGRIAYYQWDQNKESKPKGVVYKGE